MKKIALAVLAPLALSSLVGCASAGDMAGEDVGEAAQASSSTTVAWSGLPAVLGSESTVACTATVTSGSSTVAWATVSLTITPGTSSITLDEIQVSVDGSSLCSSARDESVSAGSSVAGMCNGASGRVAVGTDSNGNLTLALTDVLVDDLPSSAFTCPATVVTPGVTWYAGESQTGAGTAEAYANGACVSVSSLGLGYTPASLALYAQESTATYIHMYTGSNCSGTSYERSAGAGTVHDINLDTVGIGSNLVSYEITW
jgi:hypothetical protein